MREPSQPLPPAPADARFGPLRLARYEKEDGRALILYSRGTDGEAPSAGAAGEGEPDDREPGSEEPV